MHLAVHLFHHHSENILLAESGPTVHPQERLLLAIGHGVDFAVDYPNAIDKGPRHVSRSLLWNPSERQAHSPSFSHWEAPAFGRFESLNPPLQQEHIDLLALLDFRKPLNVTLHGSTVDFQKAGSRRNGEKHAAYTAAYRRLGQKEIPSPSRAFHSPRLTRALSTNERNRPIIKRPTLGASAAVAQEKELARNPSKTKSSAHDGGGTFPLHNPSNCGRG